MELNCKSKILDDLFEIRGEGLIRNHIKENGKPKSSKKAEKTEKELVEFMKKFIKNENDIKILFEKINNFESDVLDEMCFWHKPYYKLGFIDGMLLKTELKEDKEENKEQNDSIIYQNFNELTDYFEERKYKNLKLNKEYQKITKEIEKIKTQFPKIRDFLENDKITKFTQEETKAILKIISLNDDRAMYEADEMLKIGIKEGKAL